ncbi:MAG: PDZ domain-containing protein [Calditrichia bacterium]
MVGDVSEGYPAAEAVLQKGDRIIAVNDSVIQSWIEMIGIVVKGPDQPLIHLFTQWRYSSQTSISRQQALPQKCTGRHGKQMSGRIGITRFTETRALFCSGNGPWI